MRLSLESIKEIKALTEILLEEDDEQQKEEIKKYINSERRKIQYISNILKEKESSKKESTEKVNNKIILVPTSSGSIRALDDIESVAIEYLPSFKELFNSIINGTFKRIKRFNNNDAINGICEVRGNQTRILFQRLDKNTYAIITAFIKKETISRGYLEYIKLRVLDYKSIANVIKNMLNDSDFIQENERNLEKMEKVLNGEKKSPSYVKEAN